MTPLSETDLSQPFDPFAATGANVASGRQIVFVMANVADYAMLIAGLKEGVEVHVLDAAGDGLAQMAGILAGRSGIDAIHLVSHGSAGVVPLGTVTLDEETLCSRQAELETIGQSLSEAGDLLLYGCNVAQGQTGIDIIGRLAQATGADVAASDDLTGAANENGDWVLEDVTGAIETSTLHGGDWNGQLGLTVTPQTIMLPSHSTGEWSNQSAFAALRTDGSVVTWGNASYGANSTAVASQLTNVVSMANPFVQDVYIENAAPTIAANAGLTLNEGGSATLGVASLSIADADTAAGNLTLTLAGIPAHGMLYKSGLALMAGSAFTQDDIANNRISYTHTGADTTADAFTFTVSDGKDGSIAKTSFNIAINPVNDAPIITSNGGGATASINVAENSTSVTTVLATDVDAGQPLSYSISGGADGARFQIDAATGALTFKAAPDFENPVGVGANNTYEVIVRASDGAATDEQTLTATVTDVNETVTPPPTPSDPLIDGVSVQTTSGGFTTTVRIDPISDSRVEDPSTPHKLLADIPLVTDATGATLLSTGLPVGVGLQSITQSGNDLTLRQQLINASEPRITDDTAWQQILSDGIDAYTASVTAPSQVTVRTLVLSAASGSTAPGQPIVITGASPLNQRNCTPYGLHGKDESE